MTTLAEIPALAAEYIEEPKLLKETQYKVREKRPEIEVSEDA